MARRFLVPAILLALGACATSNPGSGAILIETTGNRQLLTGANCVASNNNGSWTFVSPATVNVGSASGDLRVVCSKPGYRTSEYVFRPTSQGSGASIGLGLGGGGGRVGGGVGLSMPIGGLGGGSYPPRITLDMSPL